MYIFDDQGKKYLDGSSGAMTANLGHGVPEIADALADQARRLAFVSGLQFTNDPAEQLAAEIDFLTPECDVKSYFLSSGSDATEAAIKLARQYWVARGRTKKFKVIARYPGYHGNTLMALSVSGRPAAQAPYLPLLHPTPMIPAPSSYRIPDGLTFEEWCLDCADSLERTVEREGADTVSAFLFEPIVTVSAGVCCPARTYYDRILDVCHRHEILLIADEIVTGFGRTGDWFAFQSYEFAPDIFLLGKGITAGYAPLSAVVVRSELVDVLAATSGAFNHGQTFSHTPLACAAGLAAISYLRNHNLLGRAKERGTSIGERLENLRRFDFVGDIRRSGLLAGIEFVSDRTKRSAFPKEANLASRIAEIAQDEGLIVWPSSGCADGNLGDALIVAPPLTITESEIDELFHLLERSLARAESILPSIPQ